MKVELENIKGEKSDFDHEVALRLLSNPTIKSWYLPKDSKWKIDPNTNDLIRRKNKRNSEGSSEQSDDKNSPEPSSEA